MKHWTHTIAKIILENFILSETVRHDRLPATWLHLYEMPKVETTWRPSFLVASKA